MTSPEAGVKPIVVSTGMAFQDRRQARAGAEVGQDDPAPRLLRPGNPGQFPHQILIRQAMEAIATDPGGLVPPGDRHDPGDSGHVVVECGVEARDLGQVGITIAERLDQLDLAGHVIRVVRADPAQPLDQFRRDPFGPVVTTPPVDDPMPDRGDLPEADRDFEPIDQQPDRRPLIRDVGPAIHRASAAGLDDDPARILRSDPIEPTGQELLGRIAPVEERELEAR